MPIVLYKERAGIGSRVLTLDDSDETLYALVSGKYQFLGLTWDAHGGGLAVLVHDQFELMDRTCKLELPPAKDGPMGSIKLHGPFAIVRITEDGRLAELNDDDLFYGMRAIT